MASEKTYWTAWSKTPPILFTSLDRAEEHATRGAESSGDEWFVVEVKVKPLKSKKIKHTVEETEL